MTPGKMTGPELELDEMNQRYAADWLDHLNGKLSGENNSLMPPMGSLGGLKCLSCRITSECDGFYCQAHISMVL